MKLQCASCTSLTVWTRVCMAPMTQFPHLAQSQGPTSHITVISQCRTAVRNYCGGDAASQWEMASLGIRTP